MGNSLFRMLSHAAGGLAMLIVVFASPANAQRDMTGTIGYPCFSDLTCAFGNACNESRLCERCGGPGQRVCEAGQCYEDYRGWRAVNAGRSAYCGYTFDDATYAQNCGSAGFPMCPGRDYCWGASVPVPGTSFCAACGELGERCCEGNECREPTTDVGCRQGRCVPLTASATPPPPPTPLPPGSSLFGTDGLPGSFQTFDEFLEETERRQSTPGDQPFSGPAIQNQELPGVLSQYPGLRDCGCFSTDGRNNTCRQNGCAEPPNFSGTCVWECSDAGGNKVTIRGRDGVRLK